MEQPIISVSGLRGVVGISLTPDVASHYACALAAELDNGPLVLSRDGRATGRMLANAVGASLSAVGRNVVDLGVAATPTTGVMVRELDAAGGIQISASHNPAEYNGLKLFGGDGRVLSAEGGQRVLQRYQSATIDWVTHEQIGGVETREDPHAEHLRRVLRIVDVDGIRAQRFRVLLDSNHGAGGILGSRLLKSLGCEVVVRGEAPSGRFAHAPEPTAENVSEVCAHVRDARVAVGFCQDPDADRLALIDERGSYIGEEYTLAICLDHVLRQRPGPVVTNCSTSRMSQDLANKYDVPFYCSKVGEANVADAMIQHGAVFGGEGNGGPIDPRVGYVRDSFVGMALVLDAMANRRTSVSQLAAELPRYEIFKSKINLGKRGALPRERLEAHFATAEASYLDGLRLDWSEKWLLVRPSNTEPIVRLIAEAETLADAQKLCEEAATVLQQG